MFLHRIYLSRGLVASLTEAGEKGGGISPRFTTPPLILTQWTAPKNGRPSQFPFERWNTISQLSSNSTILLLDL